MKEPPNKNAAPTEAESGSFAKQADSAIAPEQAQDSAGLTLTKAWMRADAATRRNFLTDIRAGMPNLWASVDAGFGPHRAVPSKKGARP